MAGNAVHRSRCSLAVLVAGAVVLGGLSAQAVAQTSRVATTDTRTPPPANAPRVTLDVTDAELATVLDMIAQQAGLTASYERSVLAKSRQGPIRVTVRVRNVTAADAFAAALRGTGLVARVVPASGNVFVVRDVAAAEDGVIIGTVTRAKTKAPVAGATVSLGDATKGVLTGEDGTFRLPASAGEHTVMVRAIGSAKQSRRVTVVAGQSVTIDFVMEPSTSVLNEVVVTGTVVETERKAIATPITVITAADIEKRGITRIEQLFRGEIPGVLVAEQGTARYSRYSGAANVSSTIYSRGSSDLSGGANPIKTYVDGVEISDASYLGTIDPKSIERIEVITGPQAATIYGSGAMGGVMQVFTKRGSGRSAPDVTLTLRAGMMENNLSSGRTPQHNDVVSVSGGDGPSFSYSGTGTYNYSGQWLPGLFSRSYGLTFGMQHKRGPFGMSASASVLSGQNGVAGTGTAETPYRQEMIRNGEWRPSSFQSFQNIRSKLLNQLISFQADYTLASVWQHHLTVGRNTTDGDVVPMMPLYYSAGDTMISYRTNETKRTTISYNTTVTPPSFGPAALTLTVGATGSNGMAVYYTGDVPDGAETSLTDSYISRTPDRSWGGFGTGRLGLFDALYLTVGVRGESNPTYGKNVKVNWTPTTGVAYTVEHGDVTLKLQTSYGRATRPPASYMRLGDIVVNPSYSPAQFVNSFESPDLTPEYERGPQGGFELYYGNRGSVTLNHYNEKVSDLIMYLVVDSILVSFQGGEPSYFQQGQYRNIGTIRKKGWESTASFNLGPVTLKGTYSWNDSRILSVSPQAIDASSYYPGMSFLGVPTHSGNLTAAYALGGTQVTLSTNFIGSSPQQYYNNPALYLAQNQSRLLMYLDRRRTFDGQYVRDGYSKADLAMSQRLTPWASFLVNVTNLGNSYGSESTIYFPVTGRTTTVGMSLRMPQGR